LVAILAGIIPAFEAGAADLRTALSEAGGRTVAGIRKHWSRRLLVAGQIALSGYGAGGDPTASAVVADLIDVARNRSAGAHGRVGWSALTQRPIRPIDETASPFYLLMQVTDRPGVFARIATIFGEEGVSIASIVQKSRGHAAEIIMVTHTALETQMRRVLARIGELDVLHSVRSAIRVVGEV
jgi:homoserine dehydrogenase